MDNLRFQEIFDFPITEFTKHLQQESNERILFSGKYGIGKTSFLIDFFSKTDISKLYDVYHLFPINYSIASNEDIIQYIKHDIILQLLEKGKTINEDSKSYLENLPKFIKKNLDKVAEAFISMIPKIGKDIVDAYGKWKTLVTEFLKFHDETNSNEGDELISYLEKHELKEGGIFENDIVTNIIVNMVRNTEGRKSVLIVDDLDRLDPDHVFRIMNVFAAHFENKSYTRIHNVDGKTVLTNKFGFDKIILVCDFLNIESLFHHKFGPEVDFNGYADKFYSLDVYQFDNRSAISSIIKKLISLSIERNTGDDAEYRYYYGKIVNREYLLVLLKHLTFHSVVNLRSIMKLLSIKIQWDVSFSFEKGGQFEPRSFPLAVELKMLRDCIGDAQRLLNIFTLCKKRNLSFNYKDEYLGFLLWLSKVDEYTDVQRERKQISFKGNKLQLAPNVSYDNINSIFVYETEIDNGGNLKESQIYSSTNEDFWDALLLTTKKFIEIGYLK